MTRFKTTKSAASTSAPVSTKSSTRRSTRSAKPLSRKEFTGGLLIGRREFDIHCACDACPQQLDLDGADAASYLQHRRALDAPLLHQLGDPPREPVEALAPIAPRLRLGALLAEDRPVSLGRAAVAHKRSSLNGLVINLSFGLESNSQACRTRARSLLRRRPRRCRLDSPARRQRGPRQ